MDIVGIFLNGQSRRTTQAIVDYIGGDPDRFAELMKVFRRGDRRLQQFAAWPISVVAEANPELVEPYLSKLLTYLPRKDVHDAVKRSVVRLLQFVTIPTRFQGTVFSHCLDLIGDQSESIAVRAFSITVARKVADGRPELTNELRLAIQTKIPRMSAALRVRVRGLVQ